MSVAKERGILFSGEMVRALLRDVDPKTMTRRLAKVRETSAQIPPRVIASWLPIVGDSQRCIVPGNDGSWPADVAKACPFGVPGDRLAVKEHAWIWCERVIDGTTPKGRPKHRFVPVGKHVVYRADSDKPTHRIDEHPARGWRLKLGRYLPRWASRIDLEVTAVRVERLQDMTGADAIAEGVTPNDFPYLADDATRLAYIHSDAYRLFADLWESINGKRAPWATNPWVWVVSFKLLPPSRTP